ncbi:conserved protein of unknown function [Tenacibaculum sp. 190130A14a]|uniref:Bacteriocin n=1 Tax=Tenacibaculum polynesiense TaxID=3137857 RepID=A0ABP1F8F7_9FLAO
MKKSILNLGKSLNKAEQKAVNGGFGNTCGGFGSYYVNNCNDCVNNILPGAPTFCRNNCCIVAY